MSCHGLVKCLMFFVNFIFSLIGVAIVAVSAYFMKTVKDVTPDLSAVTYVCTFFIIVGIIVFLISFTGCCGAIKEINCLLVMYIIVMILLAAVKIIAVIYILTNKADFKTAVDGYADKISVDVNPSPINILEYMTKCCGTTGPNSYTEAKIPISLFCCPLKLPDASNCTIDSVDLYPKGCKSVAPPTIDAYLNQGMYALSGIALFEILSMITAIYLTCTRKKGEYYDYD